MSAPHKVLTEPVHLARRLLGSLRAEPPTPSDLSWARAQLLDGEWELFEQMTAMDQAHSITVARRFVARRPQASRDEVAGALLHDVGKIVSQLSTWERVAASLVGGRTKRFRQYHDHERIGAELAEQVGSSAATVELIAERGPAFADLHACDHA